MPALAAGRPYFGRRQRRDRHQERSVLAAATHCTVTTYRNVGDLEPTVKAWVEFKEQNLLTISHCLICDFNEYLKGGW
jgi:hypothetical protein